MFKKKKSKQASEGSHELFGAGLTEAQKEESYLKQLEKEPEWIDQEDEDGQLSVDVYQEGDTIVIKSTIAGVEPEDIDISLQDDMLTIRGERKADRRIKEHDYFFQECYWGSFSRSIILPVEVDIKKIDATIKNGILTIILPKAQVSTHQKKINVKDKNA